MITKIHSIRAYEKHTGEPHDFEAFSKNDGGAPYVVLLDGAFLDTAESGQEIHDEIADAIKWFGWVRTNPIFA